jgi:alpha-D-ribose 1-methylphosphonate 5-triphosphate diphosphatase
MDSATDLAVGFSVRIAGRRVLHPDGAVGPAEFSVRDGRLVTAPSAAPLLDAGDLLVLPGMVDVHGDAFERQVMPRPKVHFPLDLALLDTDRQLVANGITTAFHGVTWSWESGLRSGEAAIQFLDAVKRMRARLAADTRTHLRWEIHHLDAVPAIEECLRDGKIDLLAFNDHFPGIYGKRHELSATLLDRSGQTGDEYRAVLERLSLKRHGVPAAMQRLATLARERRVALLSHDDQDAGVRRAMHALGCTVAEFPLTRGAAEEAKAQACHTVFGAPNVVRGRSHTKAVRAADMVRDGLCTVLASDYYYPSMLLAPFVLMRENGLSLGSVWDLVSANPAAAAGLHDRGRLAPGLRADLILVDDSDPLLPRVAAVMVAGRFVLSSQVGEGHAVALSKP